MVAIIPIQGSYYTTSVIGVYFIIMWMSRLDADEPTSRYYNKDWLMKALIAKEMYKNIYIFNNENNRPLSFTRS